VLIPAGRLVKKLPLSQLSRPMTGHIPLQSLPSRIATGRFGRLCRALDYVELAR
jgi:hypothetical protein